MNSAAPLFTGGLPTHVDWAAWQATTGIARFLCSDLDDANIAALAEFTEPVGDHLHEIRGTIDLANDAEGRAVHARIRALRSGVKVARRSTGIGKSKRVSSMRAVMATIPMNAGALTDTEADPEHGGECIPIEGQHWARVGDIKLDRLRAEAVVTVLVFRSYYPFRPITYPLADIERHEDLFLETGEDPGDVEAVKRVYRQYLIDKTLFPQDTDTKRLNTYFSMHARQAMIRAYAASKPGLRDALLGLLPPLPERTSVIHRSAMERFKSVQAGYLDNRWARADPLSDDFDDILSAMRVRERQASHMRLQCERMRRIMTRRDPDGSHVGPDELEFAYRERVVTPDGRRLAQHQRIHMIARRASSVIAGRDPGEIIFQFLDVEADDGVRFKPWFVPLFEAGALIHPSRLPVSMRDARRKLVIELELPDIHDKPAGMAGADGHAGADLLEAGLAQGMTIIPIEPFAHAMLMAYILVRVIAITMCRIGEAIQMTYEPARWVTLNVAGRAVSAFVAIPKGWDEEDELPLDDRTVKALCRLAKLTLAREGGAEIAPSISSHELAGFKRRVAPHVFAFRGKAISEDQLNYMFRLLCAGLGDFTSHCVRHASANAANEEKIEMTHIKAMLRQRGKGDKSARRYARPTDAQVAASRDRTRAGRLDRDELSGLVMVAETVDA